MSETRGQRFDRLFERDSYYGQLHSAFESFSKIASMDVTDDQLRWDHFRVGWNQALLRHS